MIFSLAIAIANGGNTWLVDPTSGGLGLLRFALGWPEPTSHHRTQPKGRPSRTRRSVRPPEVWSLSHVIPPLATAVAITKLENSDSGSIVSPASLPLRSNIISFIWLGVWLSASCLTSPDLETGGRSQEVKKRTFETWPCISRFTFPTKPIEFHAADRNGCSSRRKIK